MGELINSELDLEQMQQDFKTFDENGDIVKGGILDKLNALSSLLREKFLAYEGLELDKDAVKDYAETKSLYSFIESLYNDVIRLDEFRCENTARIIAILKESNLYKQLTDFIKDYEY